MAPSPDIAELGDEELAVFVRENPAVLVDFWAPWCGPCLRIAPLVAELAAELRGKVRFAKVDTDAHPVTAEALGITIIPTFVLFVAGAPTVGLVGPAPKEELRSFILTGLAPGGGDAGAALPQP